MFPTFVPTYCTYGIVTKNNHVLYTSFTVDTRITY